MNIEESANNIIGNKQQMCALSINAVLYFHLVKDFFCKMMSQTLALKMVVYITT